MKLGATYFAGLSLVVLGTASSFAAVYYSLIDINQDKAAHLISCAMLFPVAGNFLIDRAHNRK